MKVIVKQSDKEITPENIGGACFSGKGMNKAEASLVQEWVKKSKAANKSKSQKSPTEHLTATMLPH